MTPFEEFWAARAQKTAQEPLDERKAAQEAWAVGVTWATQQAAEKLTGAARRYTCKTRRTLCLVLAAEIMRDARGA